MQYLPLIISILALCSSFFFSNKSSKHTDIQDITRQATERAETNVKLDNIARNVNDIKVDISSTKSDMQTIKEKLVRVEESSKQAHKRIDKIENEVHNANIT